MRASVVWSPVRTSTGVSVPVRPVATAPPVPHTVTAASHGAARPAPRGHGRGAPAAPAVANVSVAICASGRGNEFHRNRT